MNAKTLAELALKLWGVLLVLGTLLSLPAALWTVWMVPGGDEQAALMRASQIKGVVQIAAGSVLLFGREALARKWSQLRAEPAMDSRDPGDPGEP